MIRFNIMFSCKCGELFILAALFLWGKRAGMTESRFQTGTSLMIQWLRVYVFTSAWVLSLFRELRIHMSHSPKKKKKKRKIQHICWKIKVIKKKKKDSRQLNSWPSSHHPSMSPGSWCLTSFQFHLVLSKVGRKMQRLGHVLTGGNRERMPSIAVGKERDFFNWIY